jgi:two-component system, chemotaxis family, chemotaxis protein CheY
MAMSSLAITDLSILLIEPSTTQLKVILNHLKEEDINNIEGVSSGTQAIASLEKYQPDLIISSMYLPDMTAADLILTIRASESLQNTPFMLISSEAHRQALEAIRQAGVVAILPKPFNHIDLRRALRATLEFIDPEEITLESYDIETLQVLLVDDSTLARRHISRVLNNMGISHVTTANDGREAIEVFEQDQEMYDLIITDYNMPEMDGKELTEYIRNEMGNTFIPILMVTSENNEARLNNIQQAGVSAIFDKPFDPQNIKEILFRVLEDHPAT